MDDYFFQLPYTEMTIKFRRIHLNLQTTYGQKLISLICIFTALAIAMGLPRVGHIVIGYLLIYAVILSQNLKIWPILLLISVPLLNLTPYTGRFAVTEFDSLILLTFGMVWFKQKKLSYSNTQIELKLFLILTCVAVISSFNALSSFPDAEELYLTVYQQPQNIWRVAKSLLYALLLYLLIHNSDRKETGEIIRNFSIGTFASLITLTLIIFWEKGVLHTIFSGASLRSILGSALYFSIDFRPTALFSTMHTGGGSLDSYIAIMFIFPAFLLYGKPSTTAKTIFLLALMTGLYCALATVSRAVIAATAMTTIIIVIFHIREASKTNEIKTAFFGKLANLIKTSALLILWVVSLTIVQPHMGTEGLLSLPTFTFAFAVSYYQLKSGRPYILGIVFVLFGALITEALFDRIDDGLSQEEVLYKGGILVGLIALNTVAFLLKFNTYKQIKPLALPLFIFISAATFISMGFSSASLAKRLSEITQDTSGRARHWDTVKSTGGESLFNTLFGNGPGTMPLHYPFAFTGSEYFTTKQIDPIKGTLAITGSSQSIIQRITIQPEETYTFSTAVRTDDIKGSIDAAICNRNIIIQTTHNGTCYPPQRIKLAKTDKWQRFTVTLPTKNLNTKGIFSRPTDFEIKFHNFTTPIEISYFSLTDSSGHQLLLNPGFENDLDSWFWASDFQHLGWHSKNAFLHQYFELGALGLLLTLTLLASITLKTLIKSKSLDSSTQISSHSLVLNFLLLGSFITILDDPQVATFWYLGIFICSLLLSDNRVNIPTLNMPSQHTLSEAITSRINKTVSLFLNKKKLILIAFTLLILVSISTDFYTRYVYNTSPAQVIARFNSSNVAELKSEYPYLNFLWSFIENVAPKDERFI